MDYLELENSLCYHFQDINHLEIALTHSSYVYEMKNRNIELQSYERYEFLGDAVLELIISDSLFHKFNHLSEGQLTQFRKHIVNGKTLSTVSSRLGIWKWIRKGNGFENEGENTKILNNVFESIVCAIYLDCGKSFHKTKEIVLSLLKDELANITTLQDGDYISQLQEFAQSLGETISYYKVSETGPSHSKEFVYDVILNNNHIGQGTGKSIKEAQSKAAQQALALFGLIRGENECI